LDATDSTDELVDFGFGLGNAACSSDRNECSSAVRLALGAGSELIPNHDDFVEECLEPATVATATNSDKLIFG
jgi:hypothetical protein